MSPAGKPDAAAPGRASAGCRRARRRRVRRPSRAGRTASGRNRSRNSGRSRTGSPTERPRRSAATARASAFVSCGPSLLRRAARHPSGIVRLTWRKRKRADRCRRVRTVFCATLFCSTSARHRIRHGIRHTEVRVWRLPRSVCRKRPFTTHADRLRPRLKGGRLPVAGPAARRPAGRGRRRGQRLPRLRLRCPRRPPGTRQLCGAP